MEKIKEMMDRIARFRGLEDEFTIIFFRLCETYETRPNASLEQTIYEVYNIAMGY